MLKGKVLYYDSELDREVAYSIWGYSLQSSLRLVLKPLTQDSIDYLTDDTEHKISQSFRYDERVVEIYPTNTIVATKLNEETIKAYPVSRTLPALMGMAYNIMIRIGEQTKVKIDKTLDEYGDVTYGYKQNLVHFDPKCKAPTSVLDSKISYPRREGAFNLNAFYFKTDTFAFELEKTDEPDTKKIPYVESQYTVSFKTAKLFKNLGFVDEVMDELDFGSDNEKGMFLENLEEVISRYPNKNLEWIKTRDYHMVTDENLKEVVAHLKTFPHLACDTETDGLRITFKSKSFKTGAFSNQLVGIIFSGVQGEAYFFPVRMNSMPNLYGGDHASFMDIEMRPILENIPIILFNAAFDAKVFMIYDIFVKILMDVMVALQDTVGYERGIKRISLKGMTDMFLSRDAIEISELTRTGSYDNANFADVPENLVLAYACPDADNTLGLYDYIIENRILEDHNAVKLVELDSHFALAIAYQEFYGQYINVDDLPQLKEGLFTSIEDNKKIMVDCIKEQSEILVSKGLPAISELDNFNPNSFPQMLKIAYQDFKMPLQKKFDKNTKRFKPTLDKNARKVLLEILNEDSLALKFVKAFQEYSNANTMVKGFTKNLGTMMSEDGYTFSQVDQFLNTGRVAVKEPPYQNYSDSIKHHISPRPGYGMSDNDYQSIEYKVIAGLANEKRLIDAFQDPNTDYHRLQASNMFNIPYALITGQQRSDAKGFNFGIPFGMGPESLGETLRGERSPENTAYAEIMQVKYFEGQENVKNFFETRRNNAIRDGYSETIFGRRRYYDKRRTSVGAIKRQAGNQPIQGSAADFFKFAVVRFFYSILKNNLQGKILLSGFIHDEMLTEIHQSIHPIDYLSFLMEQVELRVEGFPPMFIGWGYGNNWYQAKKFDIPTDLQYELIRNGAQVEYPDWDGDNTKFNVWLKQRVVKFEHDQLTAYLINPENENTSITPVMWGYVKNCISEHDEYKKAKELGTLGDMTLDDELELSRQVLGLESIVSLIDPASELTSNEVEDVNIGQSVNRDIDYQESETTDELSYDERVALREERFKKKQFVDRLNLFGNSPDFENDRIVFKKDQYVLTLVTQYANKEKVDDSYYMVTVFDDDNNQYINTPNYISIQDVQDVIEIMYIKKNQS